MSKAWIRPIDWMNPLDKKQMVPCQGGAPCPYSKADMLECPGAKLTQSIRAKGVPQVAILYP